MFITQMEYREKSTATNWKRMQFPLHANLVAEDPALATRLLDHIAALAAFGRNENTHQFINAISRHYFESSSSGIYVVCQKHCTGWAVFSR